MPSPFYPNEVLSRVVSERIEASFKAFGVDGAAQLPFLPRAFLASSGEELYVRYDIAGEKYVVGAPLSELSIDPLTYGFVPQAVGDTVNVILLGQSGAYGEQYYQITIHQAVDLAVNLYQVEAGTLNPSFGGTGTSTLPNAGEILFGQPDATYTPRLLDGDGISITEFPADPEVPGDNGRVVIRNEIRVLDALEDVELGVTDPLTADDVLYYDAATSQWRNRQLDLGMLSGTIAPTQGGTGLSTAPTANQILIGNADGTYALEELVAGSHLSLTRTPGFATLDVEPFSLDELTDVVITSPADNQYLVYDAATGHWINSATTRITQVGVLNGLVVSGQEQIQGLAATNRDLMFATDNGAGATFDRWTIRTNATAETGANAGSNFEIIRYSDAGTALAPVVTINRATGLVTLVNGVRSEEGITVITGGVAINAGGLTASGNSAFNNNLTVGGTLGVAGAVTANTSLGVGTTATIAGAVSAQTTLTVGTGLTVTAGGASVVGLSTFDSINLRSGNTLRVNGTQVVTARQTGWTVQTGPQSRAVLAQPNNLGLGGSTVEDVARALRALIEDLRVHGLLGV